MNKGLFEVKLYHSTIISNEYMTKILLVEDTSFAGCMRQVEQWAEYRKLQVTSLEARLLTSGYLDILRTFNG